MAAVDQVIDQRILSMSPQMLRCRGRRRHPWPEENIVDIVMARNSSSGRPTEILEVATCTCGVKRYIRKVFPSMSRLADPKYDYTEAAGYLLSAKDDSGADIERPTFEQFELALYMQRHPDWFEGNGKGRRTRVPR